MNTSFELDKKNALGKDDKSSKGSWDEKIIPLCDAINSKDNYYTTSSCAGRMVLLKIPGSGTKADAEWLFVSHDKFSLEQLKESIKEVPEEQVVYRYEPFIIHVVCRTIEDADKLLRLVRSIGLKRCGIISLSKKITVEIIGTANISTLFSQEKKILLPEEYIRIMIETSNMLLEGNWKILDMLTRLLEKKL